MSTQTPDDSNNQPVIGLPGDERDMLISRVIDGIASSEDWATFRAAAAHDPNIWGELAEIQHVHESVCSRVDELLSVADHVELPGGMIDDQPMRAKMELISRWGGWAAAAAILLVWFVGGPAQFNQGVGTEMNPPSTAGLINPGLINSKPFLDEAQPDQAFDQYLSSGQSSGQVVGEMPEKIVIETRPMPDGTIEVLYLRQIIERQILDHAYRDSYDEAGNAFPVPVKLSPTVGNSF